MKFVTCAGRNACTEDGSHCRACGRSHDEINRLRRLTDDMTAFALEMGYDNVDDYLAYLCAKAGKKISAAQREDY